MVIVWWHFCLLHVVLRRLKTKAGYISDLPIVYLGNPSDFKTLLEENVSSFVVILDYGRIISQDKSLMLVGSLNLWYITATEENQAYPLAVANANTADGSYFNLDQFTSMNVRGTRIFTDLDEINTKLRLWTAPSMSYGTALLFNTIGNAHVAVNIDETKVRRSEEVRFMFYCKKENCESTWSKLLDYDKQSE